MSKIIFAQYTNSERIVKSFVYDPLQSIKHSCDWYHELINGLYTGNGISRIELMMLMSNGYEWIVNSVSEGKVSWIESDYLTEDVVLGPLGDK